MSCEEIAGYWLNTEKHLSELTKSQHENFKVLTRSPKDDKTDPQVYEDRPRLSWWFSFIVTTSSLNPAPRQKLSFPPHCVPQHPLGRGLGILTLEAVWVYLSLLAAFLVILHILYRNNVYTSQENVSWDPYKLVSSKLTRTGRFYRMFLLSGPSPSSGKRHKCLEA